MATGGKGIHVVVPLAPRHSLGRLKASPRRWRESMAEEEPERYRRQHVEGQAQGQIFVDYLRNGRGATAISPYSTRARAGAPVATPVSWQQLARLKDAHPAGIKDARKLLKADPWPDYEQVKQALPLDKLK